MEKIEGQQKSDRELTAEQLKELAEVFLMLEKWQYELDYLKRHKGNQHLDQHHSPTGFHQQD